MRCQHDGIVSDTEFSALLLEIKMAVAKPEVVITRVTSHLEMKFQLLIYVRKWGQHDGSVFNAKFITLVLDIQNGDC